MGFRNQVLILVGGLGTRLRSEVSDVPKPMAPILNKPFLEYKLSQLKAVGAKNIIFCAGYLHEIISDYFGDGSNWDLNIEYSIEHERLGTAGAIKNAENLIQDDFFAMNGDTYLKLDLAEMKRFHYDNNADFTMAVTDPRLEGQEGLVEITEEGIITGFKEKAAPTKENPVINGGVYFFKKPLLKEIPPGEKVSLEYDIFPKIIENHWKIVGFPYHGYFVDIGVPENYKTFIEDVKTQKIN